MPTSESLVSVIIPCYNAALYLSPSLESVINQTYKNIEIIIVNDGSTDNTGEIVKSFNDKRIKYFFQQNKGQCIASNFGIQKSSGDYIKFFDADDLMNPQHLEEQLKRINGNTTNIASCAWGRFYDGNFESTKFIPETVWKDMLPIEWLKAALSQKYDMMGAWLWLIPRELLEKSGGWDERLSLNNDFEFSIRLLLNAEKILFASKAVVYYRSGLMTTLSQFPSKQKMEAWYLSNEMGCSYLMKAEGSLEMKKVCANRYQYLLFEMYPEYPDLVKQLEIEIGKLGGAERRLEGGKLLHFIEDILGWKKTKLIRRQFQKIGYKKLPFN